MSFRRNPSFSRSPSMVFRADVQRKKVQNASWRKRQQSLMVVPKKFSGPTLFQSSSLGPEQKGVDTILTDIALPVTDAFTGAAVLNLVAAGTNPVQRVGRKMRMTSFQYRFHLGTVAGAPANGNVPVRILVVYDRQPNGAAALNTDLLSTANFQGVLALTNSERFLVVSDQIHECSSAGPTVGKVYKKLSLDTMWSSTSGAIADIASGSLLMFIATSGWTGAPVINLVSRVRFVDT